MRQLKAYIVCCLLAFGISSSSGIAQENTALTAYKSNHELHLNEFSGHEFSGLSIPEEERGNSGNKRVQNIYLELLGNGVTYSFNYDTRLIQSDKGPGARIGLSGFALADQYLFTVPFSFNYLLGEEGQYFEVGAGATYYNSNVEFLFAEESRTSSVIGTMTFGYRQQPMESGLLFKASFVPVFGNFKGDFFFIPYYIGVGIGYSFTYLQAL